MKADGYKASQKQERRLAEDYGGQRSAASGAFWSRKGDVRTDRWLIEAKYTDQKGYRLTVSILDKIEREAILDGRKPRLDVSFGGKEWVVITRDDLDELEEQAYAQ